MSNFYKQKIKSSNTDWNGIGNWICPIHNFTATIAHFFIGKCGLGATSIVLFYLFMHENGIMQFQDGTQTNIL
jgi:hypothetical protein